ncbi:MAG: MerR family DNA-binding transcriptional regulator [Propionibacteriales bacterium]|nr:MerR family DNA-binding transcriptional regulator [Propionibacteriales bacterium]
MSIGELLGHLRAEFPDVTISKIRFLESEGLVEPQRTGAGYRKFSHADLDRLRYVLVAQRDHYLPLKVIKEHLDAMDRGLEPPSASGGSPRVPRVALAAAGTPDADSFRGDGSELKLSRRELVAEADIDEALLEQLEGFGLVKLRPGTMHYDADALVVAKTVGEMAAFGLEPRHLRSFKAAADREVGLVEQVVTPLERQRDSAAKARAEQAVHELAALSLRLHTTLVKIGLRNRR